MIDPDDLGRLALEALSRVVSTTDVTPQQAELFLKLLERYSAPRPPDQFMPILERIERSVSRLTASHVFGGGRSQ